MAELRVRGYWHSVRRRAWIPVALGTAATLIVGGVTMLSRPQYTATASVVAKTQSNGIDKTLSFQDIATSRSVALLVRGELNLDESADALARRVKVTGGQSNLYHVSVDDPDPKWAVAIADRVADQASKLYTQLGSGADPPQKLQEDETSYRNQMETAAQDLFMFQAQHPDASSSSDPNVRAEFLRRQFDQRVAEQTYLQFTSEIARSQVDTVSARQNTGAQVVDWGEAQSDTVARLLRVVYAAVLGLVVGLGVILALEYVDNSIRDADEAEQLIGAPVIGIIPRGDARALDA